MAEEKISQLPAATTPLVGDELVEIVQGGTNKKVEANELGGTATLPYLVYTALLNTNGNLVPDADVKENTLGSAVTWTKLDVGSYNGATTIPFDVTKVYIGGFAYFLGKSSFIPVSDGAGIKGYWNVYADENGGLLNIYLLTLGPNCTTTVEFSALFPSGPFYLPEIRVYL